MQSLLCWRQNNAFSFFDLKAGVDKKLYNKLEFKRQTDQAEPGI